jgi:hypothetical protein
VFSVLVPTVCRGTGDARSHTPSHLQHGCCETSGLTQRVSGGPQRLELQAGNSGLPPTLAYNRLLLLGTDNPLEVLPQVIAFAESIGGLKNGAGVGSVERMRREAPVGGKCRDFLVRP